MKPQSAGGKIMAKRQRDAAIAKYYAAPHFCKNCEILINIKENERVSDTRRKFCTRSCAATYSNRLRKKTQIIRTKFCLTCNTPVSRKAIHCIKCNGKNIQTLKFKTKEELLSSSKYWVQWRSLITKHARQKYKQLKKPFSCEICGYNLHVDICHIRDVSDFPNTATIEEINHEKNLVALCKNHHWEFDHGLLEVQGVKKIAK